MQELTDDVAIFALLENAGLAGFDPAQPIVIQHASESDFMLLLFCPAGPYKGCRLFLCPLQMLGQEVESVLLPRLLDLPEDNGYDGIKTTALIVVEQIISQRNSNRLFYDAH